MNVIHLAPPSTILGEPVVTTEHDGMRVAMVGSPEAARQVLLFMGILAHVEAFELQRFALLAQLWDAQITVVDVPGCGYGGARLLPTERRSLRRGDFTPVATRMIEVTVDVNPRLGDTPVAVVGYSMGASLAAAATGTGQLPIGDVILIEPVAIRRWNAATLVHRTRDEDKTFDEYVDRNAELPDAVAPLDRRDEPTAQVSRIDLAHFGFAISRGHIAVDLRRGYAEHPFTLQLLHGELSRLSSTHDIARLAASCRAAGIATHDIALPGRHPLWHSLPDVAKLAPMVSSLWFT